LGLFFHLIILEQARRSKKDEFYTQLSVFEKELMYYKEHFKGKYK